VQICGLWNLVFRVAFFLAASYIVRIERVFASAGNDTSEFLSRLSCGVGVVGGWSGAGYLSRQPRSAADVLELSGEVG
jgi:hypothetical protein